MATTTVLRWLRPKSDAPVVQTVIVETEEQLALRNEQKLEQAKQILGGRYVLHPSNKVIRRLEERPPTLATGSTSLGGSGIGRPDLTNRLGAAAAGRLFTKIRPEARS